MNEKLKRAFLSIREELVALNQRANAHEDEDAKGFSCYLIEIIDGHFREPAGAT